MILRCNVIFWLFFGGVSSMMKPHFPPEVDSPEVRTLPKEQQVSLHINEGETTRVRVLSERAGFPLSIATTPCSSAISWNVYFAPFNHSISTDMNSLLLLKEYRSGQLETFKTTASKIGQYVIEIRTLERPTTVQVFASEEPIPPHVTRMSQSSRMRLQKRQRRKRITVKWNQSPIDPHRTEYCLVVSSRKNYTSLCEAQKDDSEKLSHVPQVIQRGSVRSSRRANMGGEPGKDLLITCVGSKTHHTIDNLLHGQMYYFNVFAVDKETNLTFPYGSTILQYDKRIKHSRLKDGKAENVNLKKLDGKAVFKFKAGKQNGEKMLVSIMPCGGSVNIEVLEKGQVILEKTNIDSYQRIIIPAIKRGERYAITVIATNREELQKTSAVEILATTKKKFPLPQLPEERKVREFDSLKRCNSLTIGWLRSPDPTAYRYCVLIKESKKKEQEFRPPDQCTLESRMRKSADYQLLYCQEPKDEKSPMTQRITGLKPGRRYIVQVTVKKNLGKMLSYDHLITHTKSTCS